MKIGCCQAKRIYIPIEKEKKVYVDRPVYINSPENEKENYINLLDNLSAKSNQYPENSDNSSETTSTWNGNNPDHFEINIQCGDKPPTKLKVKKKYSVGKVIDKFNDIEKPQEKLGRLKLGDSELNPLRTLGELGISEDEILELI